MAMANFFYFTSLKITVFLQVLRNSF